MALSTNIYAEITTTFPASVEGAGGITITKSGGVYTITWSVSGIAVNSIDNGKLSQVAGARLIGNPTGATTDRSEISLGSDLEFSGTALQGAALTGDVTKAAGSTETNIAAGAVGTAEIAAGAVSANEIAADAVDGSRIADDSIDSEHYVDASIDGVHIADDQIDSQHYAVASIDSEHIANDQIDRQHYAAASIDHEHLADDVISGATNRTAFESGDKLLIHETGVGLRQIDYDDLPSGSASTGYMHVREEQTSGTEGGSASAATTTTRTLNTTVTNTIAGASRSSNAVTLLAGTYYMRGRAPSRGVSRTRVRIRNTSDNSTALLGGSGFADASDNVIVYSEATGRVTIAASKTFELQHYTEVAKATTGLGTAASTGEVEVYGELEIWKVS